MYLGCSISYQFSNDIELKLAKFLQLIGTIKRTIFRKVRMETTESFKKIWTIKHFPVRNTTLPLMKYGVQYIRTNLKFIWSAPNYFIIQPLGGRLTSKIYPIKSFKSFWKTLYFEIMQHFSFTYIFVWVRKLDSEDEELRRQKWNYWGLWQATLIITTRRELQTECIIDKIDECRKNWLLHLLRMQQNRILLK
jgi:hypothetical protein